MNLNLTNEKNRKKVVDDLLSRKPKGQSGTKPVYTVVEYYCYDARKHKNRVECDHPGWGYSDENLWNLGFRSEGDVREYVFNTFYKSDVNKCEYYLTSGQRAGVTRKTNRINNRINGALRRVRVSGKITGLYKVSVGYDRNFFFFGESSDEVKSLAKLMLEPIYPDEHFGTVFIDKAVPGDILDKNVPSLERISREIENKRKRAAELVEAANKMESQAEYVKTLITQNLEIAMRAT